MAPVRTDQAGLWLLKWIVVPVVAIALIGGGIHFEMMKRQCRKLAEQEGYLESTYFFSKAGSGEQCVCRKKKNADGTVDIHASHTFKMD